MNRLRFFLFSWVAITCLTGVGQETPDPFAENTAKSKDSAWGTQWQDGPATGNTTRLQSSPSREIGPRDQITFGGHGCPRIVVGMKVFSTESLQLETTLEAGYSSGSETAMSADGSYFAVSRSVKDQKAEAVHVFDLSTGKRVALLDPPNTESDVDLLKITRNKYVVTSWHQVPGIQVWKADSGKFVKKFAVHKRAKLDTEKLAFTDDGQYMAVIEHDALNVYDVAKSKVVATMQPPKDKITKEQAANTPASIVAALHKNDQVFYYAWIRGIAFAPSGIELAALSNHHGHWLFCWDQKARLETRLSYSLVDESHSRRNKLQWFPDGNAWLIDGNLIERDSGSVLLALEQPFATKVQAFVHDQNTLIARRGGLQTELSRIEIPWDRISESKKAMEDQVEAHLAPYQSVDLKLEFDQLRGSQSVAEQELRDAVASRLGRDKIKLESGSGGYFRLRLSEASGGTLPIYERQSPFDFRGKDTGREAIEAKGSLVFEFYPEGASEPLWREVMKASSSRMFNKSINDSTLRESMLKSLRTQLHRVNFPYFLPKDDQLLALPVMIP